jgi:hypothetical protein
MKLIPQHSSPLNGFQMLRLRNSRIAQIHHYLHSSIQRNFFAITQLNFATIYSHLFLQILSSACIGKLISLSLSARGRTRPRYWPGSPASSVVPPPNVSLLSQLRSAHLRTTLLPCHGLYLTDPWVNSSPILVYPC